MERSEHYSDRAILLFSAGLALILGLAWIAESFFFAIYQFQDWDRAGNRMSRYFLESGYALRPAGLLLLYCGILTVIGNLLNYFRLSKTFLVLATTSTCLLILWPMIRVVVYYYMRLEVTMSLL